MSEWLKRSEKELWQVLKALEDDGLVEVDPIEGPEGPIAAFVLSPDGFEALEQWDFAADVEDWEREGQ